jgi:hypothetical protein
VFVSSKLTFISCSGGSSTLFFYDKLFSASTSKRLYRSIAIHMSLLGLYVTVFKQFVLNRSVIADTVGTDCDYRLSLVAATVISGVRSYICGNKGQGSWGREREA